MELQYISALQTGAMLKERKISCRELTEYSLRAIEKTEPQINAYAHVFADTALAQADSVQQKLDSGEELSPLAGVPMGLKDNICTEGLVTSCGSKMLENFVPPYSASVYSHLEQAGTVLLGKLNMDEFAMGGSTETSYFGLTRNPWDTNCVPGGSSGGAAAAVAAGSAFYSLGSDTGGSIRQPCAFCGTSGIKPTYGSVSRYGLVAYASSLDQIGPIARDIRDCAEILRLIGQWDPLDSTSAKRTDWDFSECFSGSVEGLRIGIPSEYFADGLDSDVGDSVMEAVKELERLGATLVPVSLPLMQYAVPAYYIIACAEASSNLSRYDGIKYGYRASDADELLDMYRKSRSEGFGIETKQRIMLGSFVLSSGYYDAYYKKAMQARVLIQQGFSAAFESCDIIAAPNAPTTAYPIGENISDPLKMYLGDIYTVSVNLAGLPAASIPCGFARNGLPVGLQLIGRPFDEATILRCAHAFQLQTDYHRQLPKEVSAL